MTRRLEILIDPDQDGVRCGGCRKLRVDTNKPHHDVVYCEQFPDHDLAWIDKSDDPEASARRLAPRCQPCLDADRGEVLGAES